MTEITKRVVRDVEIRRWTELGWVFSAPAYTRGHSVVCWLRDDKPRFPEGES